MSSPGPVEVREVDPRDAGDFDAWFAVQQQVGSHAFPGEPGWQRAELLAQARTALEPDPPFRAAHLLAAQGGRDVGAVRLGLPQRDNRSTAEVFLLSVLPDARRRGVGRALLDAACDRARQAGRAVLVGTVDEPARASERPGPAFALAQGAVAALAEERRDLAVPLDPALLDRLEAQARAASLGYALRTWQGAVPDDLLEDRALLARRISTDAPSGDLPREEQAWDGERVRAAERELRDSDRDRLSVGAVDAASGRMVGVSDVCLPRGAPERAYQWDTLVLREHRGHRLGLLLKVANLRRVAQEWPATRTVSTWNAASNAPMIAVNEALGAELTGIATAFRLPLRAAP